MISNNILLNLHSPITLTLLAYLFCINASHYFTVILIPTHQLYFIWISCWNSDYFTSLIIGKINRLELA